MGPTASGKTAAAISLASQFPVDIISVDATQVYRGMNIGTAKPPPEILREIPHRLIDICDPADRYSAGDFRRDALREISKSMRNGRIPCLVGGSMFYFRALEQGLSELPRRSIAHSAQIDAAASEEGWSVLHERLRSIDPNLAATIAPGDTQRIRRMLEIYMTKGRAPSEVMHESPPQALPFAITKIVLSVGSRRVLHDRIRARFHQMLDLGFVEEARGLHARPELNMKLASMRAVGYRQAWQYFDKVIDYDEMVRKSIQSTCSIAKRQLTWLRNDKGCVWLDTNRRAAIDLLHEFFCLKLSNTESGFSQV